MCRDMNTIDIGVGLAHGKAVPAIVVVRSGGLRGVTCVPSA